VTGGLEHPGVVPVYGLGVYPDGRPFYAMRLIKGDSLKDAIRRFHAADGPGRDPGERRLALRGLLGQRLRLAPEGALARIYPRKGLPGSAPSAAEPSPRAASSARTPPSSARATHHGRPATPFRPACPAANTRTNPPGS
jgi:hypothetical protein